MNRAFIDVVERVHQHRSFRSALGKAEQRNLLLDSFPADVVDDLQLHLRRRHLQAGEMLREAGDPISEVCFPVTAAVVFQAVLQDGHSLDVAMAGREGAIGVGVGLSSDTAVRRAAVLIAGVGDFIAADRFVSIVSSSSAARNLIAQYGDVLLLQSQQLACCCSHHNIKARLASWLLRCRDCTGDEELPVTQELAAQSLGVRRTTVTLAARELQAADVIRYRRGRIDILNEGALRAACCECYATTWTQSDSILSLNNRL